MGEIYSGYNEVPSNCNMSEDEKFLFDLFRDQKFNSNPISEETFLPVLKYLRPKYEKIDVNKISEISDKIGKEKFWLIIKSQVLNSYIRESGSDYKIIPRDWLGELSLLEPSLIELFFQRKYPIGKDDYQKYSDIMGKIYTKLLESGYISTISQNIEAFGKNQWQLARDCLRLGYIRNMWKCLGDTGDEREEFSVLIKIISAESKLLKFKNFKYVTNCLDFRNMRIKDLIKLWDISYEIECNNNVSDDLKMLINECKEKIIRAFQEFDSIDEVVSNEEMRRFCEFTKRNSMYLCDGCRNYNSNDNRFHIVKNGQSLSCEELPDWAKDSLNGLHERKPGENLIVPNTEFHSDKICEILRNIDYDIIKKNMDVEKKCLETVEKIYNLLNELQKHGKFNVELFHEILQYPDYPHIIIDDENEVDSELFHDSYNKFLSEIFKFFCETKYENLGITHEDYDSFFRILANKWISIDLGIGEIRKSNSLPF